MSFRGSEHANFFRNLTNGVTSAISREKHITLHNGTDKAKERWENWEQTIQPAMEGSAIVTFIANVEHLIGKDQNGQWNIPSSWYGKSEFNNFKIIRHCFAHAAGRVLPNRRQELNNFLQNLKNNGVIDRNGNIVAPYYEIVNDKIYFMNGALERLRLLCSELLAENGDIEKWY